MVIAETKRQMHETLEMKEEEVAQLRARIKQITTQGEELKEQKEKFERAGKKLKFISFHIWSWESFSVFFLQFFIGCYLEWVLKHAFFS